jgi:hypothetical protein
MGQDRPLSEEQREFVLENVQNYNETWTRIENDNLRKDLQKRSDTFVKNKDYLEGELAQNMVAEEEKFIEDYYDSLDDPVEEEAKADKNPELRNNFLLHKLCEDIWKTDLLDFKEYRVVKFSRFFQSFFYFLGHNREEICEEGTNKLFWKKAKNKLNDGIFERMKNYTHLGPKVKEYKRYQLLNFVEKNIEGINVEDIEQYSYVLSRLYKWMTTIIEMRKEDIQKRREIKEKEREEREQAIVDHKEWKENRQRAMEETQAEFEAKQFEEEASRTQETPDGEEAKDENGEEKLPEEKPKFNEEEYFRNYDVENPPVVIPDEIIDAIDNDFEIANEKED